MNLWSATLSVTYSPINRKIKKPVSLCSYTPENWGVSPGAAAASNFFKLFSDHQSVVFQQYAVLYEFQDCRFLKTVHWTVSSVHFGLKWPILFTWVILRTVAATNHGNPQNEHIISAIATTSKSKWYLNNHFNCLENFTILTKSTKFETSES